MCRWIATESLLYTLCIKNAVKFVWWIGTAMFLASPSHKRQFYWRWAVLLFVTTSFYLYLILHLPCRFGYNKWVQNAKLLKNIMKLGASLTEATTFVTFTRQGCVTDLAHIQRRSEVWWPGARSKFGKPMFETGVFRKQMYCIEESTCDIVGTFLRPPQSFDALHSDSAHP